MAVPINVCAANQKIKVNPVYQNSKVIKGKTKKRYRVQAKIGKKKYQTKADRKGNFRLRIPKQSVGKSFYIKVYRGKRYILKKKIHVLTKSIKIQRRIPIRINEADQQKFFDWMHRAEIPYCPLQDLNKNDVYAEFVIDERDILRLQSIVDRNQREFSMEDFKIINWEDYAMNHITEEDLDALAKEMNIDLEKEANQKLPSQAKENDMEELKNKVFLDDFAKGNAVAITCNKKLLNKKLSDETQLTFRIPGELDKFVSIPMKDLILTDGGKTYLGRLDLKKEYTVYDSMNRSLYHRNGMQLKRNFDDVTRSEFTQKKPSKMNTKQR